MRHSRAGHWAAVLAAGLVVAGAGCERKAAGGPPAKGGGAPVPVVLGRAVRRDAPVTIRTIGTIEPVATVTVKPQVWGQLTEVKIREGQEVRAGDVLFVIDPRPFQAALREAEANLARNKALAEDARRSADQMSQALQGAAATSREVDQTRAVADAADAAVQATQALIETAKLNLEYCTIRSPIDGQAGVVLVKAGNVVKEKETELLTINQIAPINATFAVPEQHLSAIRKGQAASALPVEVAAPGDTDPPAKGSLTFIDNKVDVMTGTIRLRGTFANADRRLWPGQFVNVALQIGVDKDAVVVPASAVQVGQQGQYVFVVKADKSVEMRVVSVERADANEAVVREGLGGDETLVTDGQLRLIPGSTVQARDEAKAGEAKPQEKAGS